MFLTYEADFFFHWEGKCRCRRLLVDSFFFGLIQGLAAFASTPFCHLQVPGSRRKVLQSPSGSAAVSLFFFHQSGGQMQEEEVAGQQVPKNPEGLQGPILPGPVGFGES